MKLIIIFLLISFSCFSQTEKKPEIKIDTTQLFLSEVGDTLTLKEFQQWLFRQPISPEKYTDFMQWYQGYFQAKFDAWLRQKKQK